MTDAQLFPTIGSAEARQYIRHGRDAKNDVAAKLAAYRRQGQLEGLAMLMTIRGRVAQETGQTNEEFLRSVGMPPAPAPLSPGLIPGDVKLDLSRERKLPAVEAGPERSAA